MAGLFELQGYLQRQTLVAGLDPCSNKGSYGMTDKILKMVRKNIPSS